MIPFGKGQLSSNLAPSYEQQKKPWTLSRSSTDGKILIFISYNKNPSREKLIHKGKKVKISVGNFLSSLET